MYTLFFNTGFHADYESPGIPPSPPLLSHLIFLILTKLFYEEEEKDDQYEYEKLWLHYSTASFYHYRFRMTIPYPFPVTLKPLVLCSSSFLISVMYFNVSHIADVLIILSCSCIDPNHSCIVVECALYG